MYKTEPNYKIKNTNFLTQKCYKVNMHCLKLAIFLVFTVRNGKLFHVLNALQANAFDNRAKEGRRLTKNFPECC